MRYLIWISCGLLFACGSMKNDGSDFTRNQSRTAELVEDKSLPELTGNQRGQIVKEAHKLIGKRYAYGETGPNAFDCSGLTSYVYGKCGVDLPRRSEDQAKIGKRLHIDDIREGDLVIFTKGRKVSHVGVCIERNRNNLWVIHSTTSNGVIKENVLSSPYWSIRVREGRQIIR